MRYDWFAGTVRAPHDELLDVLARSLGALGRRAKGQNGYAEAVELVEGPHVVARVLYGGRNGAPHVYATGADAPRLAGALQAGFAGRFGVTRMDACEDFDGPGTWDRLAGILLAIAVDRNLSINQAGDWHRERDGRTLYIGAPSSAVRIRLYEKGKELRVKGVPGSENASLDLCRVEVQVRPEKDSRAVAAKGQPLDAYGYSDWSREVARQLFGADVERVHVKESRDSDDERAFRAFVKQYAGVLDRLASERGSWDLLLAQLERRAKAELLGRSAA